MPLLLPAIVVVVFLACYYIVVAVAGYFCCCYCYYCCAFCCYKNTCAKNPRTNTTTNGVKPEFASLTGRPNIPVPSVAAMVTKSRKKIQLH